MWTHVLGNSHVSKVSQAYSDRPLTAAQRRGSSAGTLPPGSGDMMPLYILYVQANSRLHDDMQHVLSATCSQRPLLCPCSRQWHHRKAYENTMLCVCRSNAL